MTDLRQAAQQALEALENAEEDGNCEYGATDALRAALEQPEQEQTCNCRWVGDVQTQQCTLHEAHVDAIHEWAERAKTAEAALAQQEQGPVAMVENGTLVRSNLPSGYTGPLYTHPPHREWVSLTEEEMHGLYRRAGLEAYYPRDGVVQYEYERRLDEYARAIEQALKERNNG
jgi:hypothetical protein